MDRVVATYRIGPHEVDVVETLDDEGSWFRLLVDGTAGEDMLARPPTESEVTRLVLRAQR